MMDFKEKIITLLAEEEAVKKAKLKKETVQKMLAVPPDPKLGNYAFPCFSLGKNPKEEAEKLKKKFDEIINKKKLNFVSNVEVAGPYLNFFLDEAVLAEEILPKIKKEKKRFGYSKIGKEKVIVIDFSSPNIAKPFGIGHLRSTVIGNSLYHLHDALGYKVVGVNHLGDWGTQFGKLIVAFNRWGDQKKLKEESIKHLLDLYVRFHKEAEKDEKLIEEAREQFKKLEDGDKNSLHLWATFRQLSLKEFQKIYDLMDVKFDSHDGEAFYNNILDQTIKEVQSKVKTEISDGALIVNLENKGMAPLLLKKSNGTTTYHTRDLAALLYRLKKYHAEKIVYVVGSEQKLHFKQLFAVAEMMKIPAEKIVHVDFGLFQFPEGKMSTRKGNVIFLEEVLDKAIKLAEKIIQEKNPGLKDKKKVARKVGIGAIIFGDLSTDRIRNVDFDWNRMLSFEGETGPYLQYTHARACSILMKAESVKVKINYNLLKSPQEKRVIDMLSKFPETVEKSAVAYKPHLLCRYLLDLAQAFNEFYHACQVISDDKELMKARLTVVGAVRQVLENGLKLLGIDAPEQM